MNLSTITILDHGVGDVNLAFLVLRLVGLVFAAHGAQKLFGAFGGAGIPGTIGMTTALGLKNPKEQAYIAGINEFGGGLLLFFGFLTPLGAAMLIATMVVAIGTVHLKNGFFASDGGFEFNLVLIIVAFFLATLGPGEWSLDHAFGLDLNGLGWGLIALVAGAVGGYGVLATRNAPPAGK